MAHISLQLLCILLLLPCTLLSSCNTEDLPTTFIPPSLIDTYALDSLYIDIPEIYDIKSDFYLEYRLLDPTKSDSDLSDKKIRPKEGYPLIIFLHGNGDNESDTKILHFAADYFKEYQNTHPCYVVYPRCKNYVYWTYPVRPTPFEPEKIKTPIQPSYMYPALLSLIGDLKAKYPIDTNRVIIIGFSMGGFGALDMAARSPQTFAAVVSIAGGLNIKRAEQLKDMSVWLEHCQNDRNVPYALSESLALELSRIKGDDTSSLSIHIYPGGSHTAFNCLRSSELINWIYMAHR